MPTDTITRFHLSLNVSDLTRSVAFYKALFNQEPAKLREDYAKFEPDEPPLVLSLEPAPPGAGGALNHVGIRLTEAKTLVELQTRLEAAGLRSIREDGVECCYARQTKFWLHDPDGTMWEFYTFEGDIDHRGPGQKAAVVLMNAPPTASRVEWEQRADQLVPERIPLDDDGADEVRLRGTLNLALTPAQRSSIVAEAFRVLKPGGRLFVHVLTGERAVSSPELPGPAMVVKHVPPEAEPVSLLERAGFVDVRMLKFASRACFVRNGVPMREAQIEGFKPAAPAAADGMCDVVYRGPFEAAKVLGQDFPRGVRVRMLKGWAERLRREDFTVIERDT